MSDLKGIVIPFLRNQGVAKIAYVGFCFGGYVTLLGCQEADVACGVGIHSSAKIFNMHGSDERAAATKVTCPQMIIQGHNDPENTKPNGAMHEELLKHSFGSVCSLHEFPDVAHGWVPRGDLSDEVVARNVKDAMDLCTSFLNIHLMSDITCCCPVPMSA
jgi:dienelactone hydrolase